MKTLSKKGFNINSLLPLALVFVVTGIAIAYGLSVVADVRDNTVTNVASCGLNSSGGTGGTILYTACGEDFVAANRTIHAVAEFPARLGLMVTVVIASIVLVILVKYLAGGVR